MAGDAELVKASSVLRSVSSEDPVVELCGSPGALVGVVVLWVLWYGPGWDSAVCIVGRRVACCSGCVLSDIDGMLVGPYDLVVDAGLVDLVPGPLCDRLQVPS